MLNGEESKRLALEAKANILIWLAIVGSLFLYLAVGYFLIASREDPYVEGVGAMGMVLGALSVVSIAAALVFRNVVLALKTDTPLTTDKTEIVPRAFARYRQRLILSLALAETVGIYGLVMAIIAGDLFWGGSLIAVGIVFQVLFRPSANVLEEYAVAQKKLAGS